MATAARERVELDILRRPPACAQLESTAAPGLPAAGQRARLAASSRADRARVLSDLARRGRHLVQQIGRRSRATAVAAAVIAWGARAATGEDQPGPEVAAAGDEASGPAGWVCEVDQPHLAVDETVILLHPLSTFSSYINRNGEGMSAK